MPRSWCLDWGGGAGPRCSPHGQDQGQRMPLLPLETLLQVSACLGAPPLLPNLLGEPDGQLQSLLSRWRGTVGGGDRPLFVGLLVLHVRLPEDRKAGMLELANAQRVGGMWRRE